MKGVEGAQRRVWRGRWAVAFELIRSRVMPVLLAFVTLFGLAITLVWYVEHDAPETKITTFSDAVWFGVVTLSTVGYGDAFPVTVTGRAITGVFILVTLVTIGFLLTAISDAVAEVRRMEREGLIGTTFTGHVIVCGFGAIAQSALTELIAADRRVALLCGSVEELSRARAIASEKVLFVTSGDAVHEVLDERLNARNAESAVVAFDDDTRGIVATLNLRALNPKLRIVVAVNAPELRKTLIASGVTYVASPAEFSGRLVASAAFEPEVASLLDDLSTGSEGFDLRQYDAHPFVGKTVRELRAELLEFEGPLLVGLARRKRGESGGSGDFEVLTHPPGAERIVEGDQMMVLTDGVQAERMTSRWPSRQGR